MGSVRIAVTDNQLVRFLVLLCRCVQWPSAVIVLGITGSFVNSMPQDNRGLLPIYTIIIAATSVAFFIPAFISPFIPIPALKGVVILVDVFYSHLWLTAFIFSALDYNKSSCKASVPPGRSCSTKFAEEAFIFLTFIFTFFALFLESTSLWFVQKEKYLSRPPSEKNSAYHQPIGHNGAMHNPEEAQATAA